MYFRSLHHNELNIGIFNRNALTLTGGFYFSWFRIHSFRAHTIRMGLTDRIRPGGSIYPGKLPAISREIPPEMRLPIQDSPGNSPGNFPAAPPNFPGNPRRIHRLSFPWILPGGIPGKCPEFPAKWISLEMDFPGNSAGRPGNFAGNPGTHVMFRPISWMVHSQRQLRRLYRSTRDAAILAVRTVIGSVRRAFRIPRASRSIRSGGAEIPIESRVRRTICRIWAIRSGKLAKIRKSWTDFPR